MPNELQVDEILAKAGSGDLNSQATAGEFEGFLRRLASEVAHADPIRRGVVREAAAKRLAEVGVRSPAGLVDAALSNGKPESAAGDIDVVPLVFRVTSPVAEPVEGSAVLDEIEATIKQYVAVSDAGAVACTLWIAHSYAIDVFNVSPILAIASPVKRCGKTTLLTLLTALVPKPLPASNITPAVVFRTIEAYVPTLLVDEADSFITKNDELRGVLNSGHTRSTAQVLRTVGDQYTPQVFSTWCAKAIALIGQLPATLEDRSVVVQMRRRARDEAVKRLRLDRVDLEMEQVRARVARWTIDETERLRLADPDLPGQLNDRAQDNWRPLISIADAAGAGWPERARRAAIQMAGFLDEGDQAPGVQLLADLHDLFTKRGLDRLDSRAIVEALVVMEDRPWPEWRQGKPLTQRQLARLLKPFDVRPKTIRLAGNGTAKGYVVADLADAFGRYLPSDLSHRNNVSLSHDSADSEAAQGGARDGRGDLEKAQDNALVTAVTDRRQGPEEELDDQRGPDKPNWESFEL